MGDTSYDDQPQKAGKKMHNTLPIWGNEQTMNLNPLILANIQGSSYFKVHLFKLKTYHEVIDEIYYQVKHLEPWERGSRKTAGQTGMCGGVRGVGAGGIVSTAYCLLYKLYTLRLTRKQLNGLLTHTDSPYIRALGFMYIRYTQPPADLFDWYEEYLEDEEEVDPKAGGGQLYQMGQLVRQMMVKLDWFSTLFPRIPVPIQKQIEQRLAEHARQLLNSKPPSWSTTEAHAGSVARDRDRTRDQARPAETDRYSRDRNTRRDRDNDRERNGRDKVERRDRDSYKDNCRDKERDRDRDHHKEKERDRDRHRIERERDRRERPRSRDRQRARSRSKERRHR